MAAEQYTVLQLVVFEDTGDSCYRMRWPGLHLASQAPDWRIISLDARAEERLRWAEEADLLVIYQSHDPDLFPILRRRRAQGKPTLVEYNDNFYAPPIASPVYEAWSSPLTWQAYERFIELADGLIVTGPGLLELFSARTRTPIFVLENHLPAPPGEFEESWLEPGRELRLGWGGSLGHLSDLMAYVPVLNELLEELPQLRLCLMGSSSLGEILPLPPERVCFTPWGSMKEYYRFWKGVHLGFAPLLETPYNRCRSDVKALEMSACAVLPLLPELTPYKDFLRASGIAGFSSIGEFRERVRICAARPGVWKADAHRCHRYVREHRLGKNRRERLELYAQFLSGKPSGFAWPMPGGYHEVRGSPAVCGLEQVREEVGRLLKAGDPGAAAQLLLGQAEANGDSAELQLYAAGVLLRAGQASCDALLRRAIRDFPRDVRFRLLAAQTASDLRVKEQAWEEILGCLEAMPGAARDFYRAQVLSVYFAELGRQPRLAKLTERLLFLYPESEELRFHLARCCLAAGDYRRAASHFSWLHARQRYVEANQAFFQSLNNRYFAAWAGALSGEAAERQDDEDR